MFHGVTQKTHCIDIYLNKNILYRVHGENSLETDYDKVTPNTTSHLLNKRSDFPT
jgi:hypothetical protein